MTFITFLRQSLKNFSSTGAIVPSSPFLARSLAAPLSHRTDDHPVRILEAGPGTGALTVEIVRHLRPGDELILSEINACFVEHLEGLILQEPHLYEKRDQIKIFHGPVEEMGADNSFDHIISGLPFNNFPPELVEHIFTALFRAIRTGGTISFFEYVAIRRIKRPFLDETERERVKKIESLLKQYTHTCKRDMTLLNFPPAWACHIDVTESTKSKHCNGSQTVNV